MNDQVKKALNIYADGDEVDEIDNIKVLYSDHQTSLVRLRSVTDAYSQLVTLTITCRYYDVTSVVVHYHLTGLSEVIHGFETTHPAKPQPSNKAKEQPE